jgi:hypothetical protein
MTRLILTLAALSITAKAELPTETQQALRESRAAATAPERIFDGLSRHVSLISAIDSKPLPPSTRSPQTLSAAASQSVEAALRAARPAGEPAPAAAAAPRADSPSGLGMGALIVGLLLLAVAILL